MRPLENIRVLDLSRLLPGPYATLALAELGATVDKVEDPSGDYLRHMPPLDGDTSRMFVALNHGKRSIVLDLRSALGRDALLGLAARYDVIVEQFRPGVLERLGVGPTQLLAASPRAIVCSITGYGQSGPLAHRAGHDLNYLARSGLLGITGPAAIEPALPGFQVADTAGALWAVIAILGALRERDRTGVGTHLDISMSEAAIGFGSLGLSDAWGPTPAARGHFLLAGGTALYRSYRTKDERYVVLAALEPKFYFAFCSGVGIAPDPSALVPGPHQEALAAQLEALFRSRTRDEWTEFGQRHDACVEPVLDPTELSADPQFVHRKTFARIGDNQVARTPVSDRERGLRPAPKLGQHTEEVLREAGLSADRIDALIART